MPLENQLVATVVMHGSHFETPNTHWHQLAACQAEVI